MKAHQSVYNFVSMFLRKRIWSFFIIQCLALIGTLQNIVYSPIFAKIIDAFVAHETNKVGIFQEVAIYIIVYFCIAMLIDLIYLCFGYIWGEVESWLQMEISAYCFDYIALHSYSYFAKNLTGTISAKITNLTEKVSDMLEAIIIRIIPTFCVFSVALFSFSRYHSVFSISLLIWCISHILLLILSKNSFLNLVRSNTSEVQHMQGVVTDILENIGVVKVFDSIKEESSYIQQYRDKVKYKNYEVHKYSATVKCLASMNFNIFFLYVLYNIVILWQRGLMTVGDSIAIYNMTYNIARLVWDSGMYIARITYDNGVCEESLSILQIEHDIQDSENATELKVTKGEINFINVSFLYKDVEVFSNKNVYIAAGSKVGLVGMSGSGKTTFGHLILRLYDVNEGEVCIDGQNVKSVTQRSLRSNIATIPQKPYLFSRSISENISYGSNISHEKIVKVAKLVSLHDLIEEWPKKYDTIIGKDVSLSGGQAQRVMIARVLLKNAPILLMDEATSALDATTEMCVSNVLRDFMQDKTAIVIAHRLATLIEMDRILVFKNGIIVEDGDHHTLLQNQKDYALMWSQQSGGFISTS